MGTSKVGGHWSRIQAGLEPTGPYPPKGGESGRRSHRRGPKLLVTLPSGEQVTRRRVWKGKDGYVLKTQDATDAIRQEIVARDSINVVMPAIEEHRKIIERVHKKFGH